ncbi:MAG: MFS transporter [Bacteroidetes bacterium]|nr:MFS transporter [Bacteroidota bacterium]
MNKKASLNVIFLTVFIDLMGFGILIPILPTFGSKILHISDFEIGMAVAVYSLMQFLFNPVLGKLSDRFGRRPVILISLLSTAVSYLIFSFTDSFFLLIVSRILAGLGGSNIGVAQAYIADITEKSERSKGMGIIGAAFGLGFLFGPLIGGYLSHFSYATAGFGSAAFSFMAFLFAFFSLPESIKQKETGLFKIRIFDLKFTKDTFKIPSVGLLITLFFIIVFSMANIYGTFSILGYKIYGFTDQENGLLFGIIGLTGAIVQGGLIRILSKKFSDKPLILAGTIFMVIGLGMLPYGVNFLGVSIIIIILSIGTGILQPTLMSMVSKFSPEKGQGAILGLNQSFASLARVLGPLWGGFSFEYIGYQFPFLTGAAFTFITFLITLIYLNTEKIESTKNV